MGRENTMKRTVIKLLRTLHGTSIENGVGIGTPDVAYAGGWLELKCIENWPKRELTPLRLPHFTPQQKVWLVKHSQCGGEAYILLKVAQDWLLLGAKWSAMHLGEVPRSDILAAAIEWWGPKDRPKIADKCGGLVDVLMKRKGCGDA